MRCEPRRDGFAIQPARPQPRLLAVPAVAPLASAAGSADRRRRAPPLGHLGERLADLDRLVGARPGCLVIVPQAGAGTSASTLSVETSTTVSPSAIWSPSGTCHSSTVPSVTDSPISGITISRPTALQRLPAGRDRGVVGGRLLTAGVGLWRLGRSPCLRRCDSALLIGRFTPVWSRADRRSWIDLGHRLCRPRISSSTAGPGSLLTVPAAGVEPRRRHLSVETSTIVWPSSTASPSRHATRARCPQSPTRPSRASRAAPSA